MDRGGRLALAIVGIAVVVSAGCSSFPPESDPAGTAQTWSPTEPGTETPPPEGGTDTPIEGGPQTVPADERLVLVKVIAENVTVSMYGAVETPVPTDTTAESVREESTASVTYGPEERGEMAVTEFEVDGHVVVSLDDEVIWQGEVRSYEHVKLYVDRDGDVEVSEHFVL